MDVIVNADDLGMNKGIDRAIFELIGKGLVTSASLLANGPSIESACVGINNHPSCSFGAHLNVTEFSPLSAPDKLQPILNDQGAFAGEQIRATKMTSELASGITDEFCAQIERLLTLGVRLTHIDSHHYILNMRKMVPILKKVRSRFGIARVRITRNIYAGDESIGRVQKAKKGVYNFLVRHYVGAQTTDGFAGFDLFHANAKLGRLKHRTFEALVHPGNPFYDEGEVETLLGPWRDELGFPVRLITDFDVIKFRC